MLVPHMNMAYYTVCNLFQILTKTHVDLVFHELNWLLSFRKVMAVPILPSTAIYPQRLFCRELFVIGQS